MSRIAQPTRGAVRLTRGDAGLIALREALDALGVQAGDDFVVLHASALELEGGQPKARRGDPSTARLAALAVQPRAGSQRSRLLQSLLIDGSQTCEELADCTGIAYVSASTRVTELKDGGWAEPTGRERKTSNGGDAEVIAPSPKARALREELFRA